MRSAGARVRWKFVLPVVTLNMSFVPWHPLRRLGRYVAVPGATLLVLACQQPGPIPVTTGPAPPTAAPTTQPAIAPVGSPAPAVAASPAASPAAAAPPAASPAVVGAASPSPAAIAAGAGMPMYQVDPQHTGRSAYTGPRRLALLRSFQTDLPQFLPEDAPNHAPDFQSSAAVGADNTIYVGFHGGTFFALKDSPSTRASLEQAWTFHAQGASSWQSTPAIGRDGTVYVPFSTLGNNAKTTLYALRTPPSGAQLEAVWSVDLGDGQAGGPSGNSPIIGPDGNIYALSGGGRLSAVAPNGTVRWTAQAGPAVKVSPALGRDGTIYTTSLDGKLYALTPPSGSGNEGAVKWTFDFGEHLGPTPLVSAPVAGPPTRGQDAVGSASSATIGPDGTIYVGANNSNFYAIDPNGQQKWLFEAERELAGIWTTAALSSDASTVYFGANKGGVYALNTRDGSQKWQFSIFGSVYSSPILDARGTLYIGSTVGHLFAIDSSSGQGVADYNADAPIWTAPALRPDGTLVAGDRSGRVLVLGEPD